MLVRSSTRLLIAPLAFLALQHCTGAKQTSTVKITNGDTIDASNYPAVVELQMPDDQGSAFCTATFVSSTTLITAAHCMQGVADDGILLDQLNNVRSTKVFIHPSATFQVMENDIAVVLFPAGTAPATMGLATVAPKVGDPFTIVGFGQSIPGDDSSFGTKHVGTNTLEDVTSEDMLGFAGVADSENGSTDHTSASGEGDSGGPLLINNKLAGTTSGGGQDPYNGDVESLYVNLQLPDNLAFLRQTVQSGAVITGLDGSTGGVSSGGSTTPSGLYVGLGAGITPSQPILAVSASTGATEVDMCLNTIGSCTRATAGVIKLQSVTYANKNVFESTQGVPLTDGQDISFVSYDANGKILGSVSIVVHQS